MNVHVADLRAAVANADVVATDVSAWSVGMHVHHCGRAMSQICDALGASKPPPPPSKIGLVPSMILRAGRIPRGKGKASASILPREDVTPVELGALLDDCERKLADAVRLDQQAWFRHPVFGTLDRDGALRFVGIHNRHHVRIIEDILAARRSP